MNSDSTPIPVGETQELHGAYGWMAFAIAQAQVRTNVPPRDLTPSPAETKVELPSFNFWS